MTIRNINHINIASSEAVIERCRAFYTSVLGLMEGPRPPFTSRGYWLYAGTDPVVHLLIVTAERTIASASPLDHIAFACEGLDEMLAKLAEHAVPHEIDRVPASGETQIFLRDPAGVGLELNFP